MKNQNQKKQQSNKKTKNNKNNNNNNAVVSETNVIPYSKPRVSDDFRFRKREFVKNIKAYSDFTVETSTFNPGMSDLFPWLSGIGNNFEKYKVHSVKFIFETSQSTFVPGTISMAPEFNVADLPPDSKPELLEYAYARRSAVWKNFDSIIPAKAIMNYKEYYTRQGPVGNNVDLKLYDPFYWIIAVDGVPSSAGEFIGELWIEYDIQFFYPQRLNSKQVSLGNSRQFQFSSAGFALDGPLIGGSILLESGSFPVNVDLVNNVFSFPEGFSGIWIYVIYGNNEEENSDYRNILEAAVLTNVTVQQTYLCRGDNEPEDFGQVTYTFNVVAGSGGSIKVNRNGFAFDKVTVAGISMFYNNVSPILYPY